MSQAFKRFQSFNKKFVENKFAKQNEFLKKNQNLYPDNWDEITKRIKRERNYTCETCGDRYAGIYKRYLHVHHKVSVFKGGSSSDSNLVLVCQPCHELAHGGKKILFAPSEKVKSAIRKYSKNRG